MPWIKDGQLVEPVNQFEMIAYPYVLDHQGRRYMLYNGNDYGRSGHGGAVFHPDNEET